MKSNKLFVKRTLSFKHFLVLSDTKLKDLKISKFSAQSLQESLITQKNLKVSCIEFSALFTSYYQSVCFLQDSNLVYLKAGTLPDSSSKYTAVLNLTFKIYEKRNFESQWWARYNTKYKKINILKCMFFSCIPCCCCSSFCVHLFNRKVY
jgi:hypothetical protein